MKDYKIRLFSITLDFKCFYQHQVFILSLVKIRCAKSQELCSFLKDMTNFLVKALMMQIIKDEATRDELYKISFLNNFNAAIIIFYKNFIN
ncbi:unnamed protein product [Blepharisma stoltei]|uniref:Uncharacterized protein n=1 Tax=Blepharisma stoltei TaxID=1481888 RepID=A0AAU9KCY9_9CILI|nr:unnamed protein product [Blepharisma stoltei]